jgi:hypothetical protein
VRLYGKFFFLLDQKTELSNYNKDEIKLKYVPFFNVYFYIYNYGIKLLRLYFYVKTLFFGLEEKKTCHMVLLVYLLFHKEKKYFIIYYY